VIGFTKLLCGTATVAEALNYARSADSSGPLSSKAGSSRTPHHLLQFTTADRPLVVWNTTALCNLRCLHCYAGSAPDVRDDQLTTAEAEALIDDLAALGTPVLLLSGGEPLLRPDLLQLAAYAAHRGLRPVLSTNGTLITAEAAKALKAAGVAYVGVSLDGDRETHDRMRQCPGAFDAALAGIAHAQAAGLRAGVRMTVTRDNLADLDHVLDVVERERIPRFCLYHLVYAGRGRGLVEQDLTPAESRAMIERLIERTLDWHRRDVPVEVLTTDGHADGVLITRYVREHTPARAEEVQRLLTMSGGCSAGRKFANIDAAGNVHPCQFWTHVTLGSVRERPFSAIWTDVRADTTGILAKLKAMPAPLTGPRCGRCRYNAQCGGCRVRAEAVHGDPWGDDPTCYLTQDEIRPEERR
jgi:radical SAM protein with 4Fe4S-binding SPASM domain